MMEWWQAIIIGIVEGITEFLPISSTAHIGFFTNLFGYSSTDLSIVAFSAIIQSGAIAAAVIYFWKDIWRTAKAFFAGLFDKSKRHGFDYRFGWLVIIGSVPIVATGVFFQDVVETAVRSLWWMVVGLIGCLEGLQVKGTAQSVGERTTSSVVQTISLVIIIDAIAAIWFMQMGW